MKEIDQKRVLDVSFLSLWKVLDVSVMRSDSSDNESSEEDSVGMIRSFWIK